MSQSSLSGSYNPKLMFDLDSDQEKQFEQEFNSQASVKRDGASFMTYDDFFKTLLPTAASSPTNALTQEKLNWLWQLADLDKSGLVDFQEFKLFLSFMNAPDADYQIAFRIFDKEGSGYVTKEQFQRVLQSSNVTVPFNFGGDWYRRYFGPSGNGKLNYLQFSQVLKGLQTERTRQAFVYYDKDQDGCINGRDFAEILGTVVDGKVNKELKLKLAQLAGFTDPNARISYHDYVAFNYIIKELSHHDHMLRRVAKSKNGEVTKKEFSRAAKGQASWEVTPLEVDLFFKTFADPKSNGKVINLKNYENIVGETLATHYSPWEASASLASDSHRHAIAAPTVTAKPAAASTVAPVKLHKSFMDRMVDSAVNFGLGAIAGGIGATAVYPIDLVKTRMQNQRVTEGAERLYKNSWDCFGKVVRLEGVLGLYKGLIPQLVGVAPEKAIKLAVNDLLRDLFRNESKGDIYFPLEVLAGGSAGASQVMFTNPLEIVKIRLQVQGEQFRKGVAPEGARPKSAITIVKELGFGGLYRGASACLLRDIPFSAIYFPTYAKMKDLLSSRRPDRKPKASDLLLAGAIAGMPAASLVTPADVIKTRLQVEARKGQQTYTGIRDCFWKVLKAEGPWAFGKGAVARVFRSSPQFGVTLLAYELLHKAIAPHVENRPPEAVVQKVDTHAFREHQISSIEQNVTDKWGFRPDENDRKRK